MPISSISGFTRNRASLASPAYRKQPQVETPQIEEYEIEPPSTGPYQTNAQRRIRNRLERKVGDEELRSRLQGIKELTQARSRRFSNEMNAVDGVAPGTEHVVGYPGMNRMQVREKQRQERLDMVRDRITDRLSNRLLSTGEKNKMTPQTQSSSVKEIAPGDESIGTPTRASIIGGSPIPGSSGAPIEGVDPREVDKAIALVAEADAKKKKDVAQSQRTRRVGAAIMYPGMSRSIDMPRKTGPSAAEKETAKIKEARKLLESIQGAVPPTVKRNTEVISTPQVVNTGSKEQDIALFNLLQELGRTQ